MPRLICVLINSNNNFRRLISDIQGIRFCSGHLNDWEIAGYVASFAALRLFLMINSADTIDVNALLSASNKKGSL